MEHSIGNVATTTVDGESDSSGNSNPFQTVDSRPDLATEKSAAQPDLEERDDAYGKGRRLEATR